MGRSGKPRRIKFRCTACGTPLNDEHTLNEDIPESADDDSSYASGPAWAPNDASEHVGDPHSYVSEPSYLSEASESFASDAAYSSDPSLDRPVPSLQGGSGTSLPFDPAGAYSGSAVGDPLALEHPANIEGFMAEGSEDHPALDNPEGTLLKQEGKVHHVRNLATIQRWIVERRVLREDLISTGGMRWEPVGNHPDLEIFFQMVERLDELELAARMPPGDDYDPRPPVSDETPMGNSLVGEHEADPVSGGSWEYEPEPGGGLLEEVEDEAHAADESWEDEESDANPDAEVYRSRPNYAYEDSEPSDYLAGDDDIPGFDAALAPGESQTWDDPPEDGQAVVFVSNKKASDSPSPTLAPPEEVLSTEEVPVEAAFSEDEQVETEMHIPHEPTAPSGGADKAFFGEGFSSYGEQTEEIAHDADSEDDLAWNEDKTARQTRLLVTFGVVLLGIVLLAVYLLTKDNGVTEPPVVGDEVVDVEPVEDPVVDEDPPEDPSAGPSEDPSEDPVVDEDPVEDPVVDEDPPELTPVIPKPEPKEDPVVVEDEDFVPPKPVTGRTAATKSAREWVDEGWSRMETGDFRSSRQAFVEALAVEPSNADAHYGLGYAAMSQRDNAFAIKHYCLALENAGGRREILIDVPALLKNIGGTCD